MLRKIAWTLAAGLVLSLPLSAQAQERTIESAQRFLNGILPGVWLDASVRNDAPSFATVRITGIGFGEFHEQYPDTPGKCLLMMLTPSYVGIVDFTNAAADSTTTGILVRRGATVFVGSLTNPRPITPIGQELLLLEFLSIEDKDRVQAAFDFMSDACAGESTGF